MADRKARSVTFRTPERIGLGDLKAAIQEIIVDTIVVFQDLGDDVFLLELESRGDAEVLVNDGFDIKEFHIDCSPPHGKFLNVSILGLRCYVDDKDVKSVLREYGELKSDVIRLKYKTDHELAGLENGNRLVKMVLDKPSIPYSLRIGGEWCRIIHNNEQPVCLECNELGHTRRNCPKIRCRICKRLGHMSYNCVDKEEQDGGEHDDSQQDKNLQQPEATEGHQQATVADDSENINANNVPADTVESPKEDMEYEDRTKNLKRQHVTDSDSDKSAPNRRTRLKPVPNLLTRPRKADKKTVKASDKSPS